MSVESNACPRCQAKLKIAASMAGKKVRCPKCKEIFAVPAEEEERASSVRKSDAAPAKTASKPAREVENADDREEPVRRGQSRSRDDDDEPRSKSKASRYQDDDDDEEADRPLRGKDKKSKGNPLLLWGLVGGGVAAVLLIGGVIGAVVIINSGKGSSSSSPDGPPFAGRGSGGSGPRGPGAWSPPSIRQGPGAGQSEQPNSAPPLGNPDFTMTADQWHEEFKKNPEAAKAKYVGKVVELTGTVKLVREHPLLDTGQVELDTSGGALFRIMCFTTDKMPWLKVCPGSTIRIRGKFVSGNEDYLNYAEIVEAGSNPGLSMTAKRLAGEFNADPDSAKAKYTGKYFYVEGEVAEKPSFDSSGRGGIKLMGDGSRVVRCHFWDTPMHRVAAAKVGSKVKILGKYDDSGAKNEVLLHADDLLVLP